jgi:sugar phosphate isomerase/epimerase
MKLGFLTACLPELPLMKIADWAAARDFEALEVAAWPRREVQRPFEASHLDVVAMSGSAAHELVGALAGKGLEISALAYYENNLHPDQDTRHEIHAHLRRCVDAAVLLGCPLVGTFIGRDPTRSVSENVKLAEAQLPPLVEYAGERGVRLIVENCPMEGWHPDGYPGNLAYSPELWEWMFSLGFYLNYDPSHLTWLGIDPVAAIKTCPERILHAQAKDVEINQAARNDVGYFGRALKRTNPWDNGWYRYRVPGLGMVNWREIIDTLYQAGFTGVLSVEHEDPVWAGEQGRVLSGLLIAHAALRPFIRRAADDHAPLVTE